MTQRSSENSFNMTSWHKNNSKQPLTASQKDCPLASKLSKIDRGKLFGSMTICIEGDGAQNRLEIPISTKVE